MTYYDEPTYIIPAEAALRLGMTEGELHLLSLESGLPNYITQPGRTLYEAADVDRLARELRS